MISFRPFGRCGNFLFMAANCIAYALRHDLDFSMPYQTNDPFWNPLYLQHLINEEYIQGREDILINEPFYHYAPVPFQEQWRGKQIVLNGYYQSHKYFQEYRKEILVLFNYKWELKKDYVSVHVRRGDYLKYPEKHPYVGKDWIENAMNQFKGVKYRFFSDDIAWCKQQFGERDDCEFSEGHDIETDLMEMSCCEHNICSSSTYSWWSMWLNRNENKKVIFPDKWFCDGYMNMNTGDVIPEWCIKLKLC